MTECDRSSSSVTSEVGVPLSVTFRDVFYDAMRISHSMTLSTTFSVTLCESRSVSYFRVSDFQVAHEPQSSYGLICEDTMVGTLVKLGLGLSNRNTACVSRREVDVPRCDAMSHLQVPRRQPPRSRRITRDTPASPPP